MLDNTMTLPAYVHCDRYDGQLCTVHLKGGEALTGRAYAPLGWASGNQNRGRLRLARGRHEHWISPAAISDQGIKIVDATGVLTVGMWVRLTDDFHWHEDAYRGAEVEIVEIGHSAFSQPYNNLYVVRPLAPGARHTHLSVGPHDIAATQWFADGSPAEADECTDCGSWVEDCACLS